MTHTSGKKFRIEKTRYINTLIRGTLIKCIRNLVGSLGMSGCQWNDKGRNFDSCRNKLEHVINFQIKTPLE